MLPTFEKLRESYWFFIYTDENGKEGVIASDRIVAPAIYDEIVNTYGVDGKTYILYKKNGEGYGLDLLGQELKYIDFSNNLYRDTIPYLQVLTPGDYCNFKTIAEINKKISSRDIILCTDKNGDINIIDLKTGINFTPYYDLNKLGGNIKDIRKGKKNYSELEINRYGSDIHDDFSKLMKKHSELKPIVNGLPNGMRVVSTKFDFDKSEILDSISEGIYKGVITTDGFISIPLQYSSINDVLSRNPNNVMALAEKLDKEMDKYRPALEWGFNSEQNFEIQKKYYNDLYSYYKTSIPAWEGLRNFAATNPTTTQEMKNYLDKRISSLHNLCNEAADEASKYNNIASIAEAMTGLASSLNAIACSLQSISSDSITTDMDCKTGTNYDFNNRNSNNDTEFSLSEQTSYNRDKKTYERYDSQLSSHFAGNQVMSQSAVESAQKEMARIRTKWTSRGKSFPKFPNETR